MSDTATVSATEFKATCLELLDKLAAHKITRLTVTKRGKPVAVLIPPDEINPIDELFGGMKGCTVIPDGLDLTAPVFEGRVYAEEGILLSQDDPLGQDDD